MLKTLISILILIALSILAILFTAQAQQCVEWLISAHNWVSETLKDVFSGGNAGDLIRQLLALLTIPVGVGFIPVIIYGLVKRSWFPYFMRVIWVVWLIQTTGLVVVYKIAG